MIALRFVVRAIGFVSIAVLARILSPEDFGVIGTASVVTGIFVILQSLGISEALARLQTVEYEHVCTAWTISFLQGLFVGLGIVLVAPWAADLLKEPRLIDVLYLSALIPVISAISSPGSLVLMRNLQFAQEFKLRVSQKVFTVVVTVASAVYYGDYHGLIIGSIVGTAVASALTFYLYPYRFKVSLSKWRDFLGFSFWTMLQATAHYVGGAVDSILVKRMSNADTFGNYYTSRDLTRIFVAELVSPASQALMPGLAKIQDDQARMISASESAVSAAVTVAVGIAVLVSALSHEIARFVLGAKWTAAGYFIAPLAIAMAFGAIAEIHRGITAAMSRPQWTSYLMCLRAVLMSLACYLASLSGDVIRIAWAVAATAVLTAWFDYAVIFRMLGRPLAAWRVFWRPSLAGTTALAVVHLIDWPTHWPWFASAPMKVLIVVPCYLVIHYLLWVAVGRPPGTESLISGNWRPLLDRFKGLRR